MGDYKVVTYLLAGSTSGLSLYNQQALGFINRKQVVWLIFKSVLTNTLMDLVPERWIQEIQ